MNTLRWMLCFALIGLANGAWAQVYRLQGKVLNARLEPLSFVTVQIKDQQIGTRTDANGQFKFDLSEGDYNLVFSLIGYETRVVQCLVEKNTPAQQIILSEAKKDLNEIKIVSFKKDRAEEIIRQVIDRKEKQQQQADAWSAKVYIRATQSLERKADYLDKIPNTDSAKQAEALKAINNMNMAEVVLRVDKAYPNKIKEVREGVSKRGNSEELFYLTTTDGDFNLYNNLVNVPALTQVPMLSPLSYSGLLAYKYKTLRIDKKPNATLYTIQFSPSRLGNALFDGEMTIVDTSWTIVSARYRFPKFHLIEYKVFEVFQQYEYTNNSAWMTERLEFTYQSKTTEGTKKGQTVAVFSDYTFDVDFAKRHFNNELSTTTLAAYERDSTFWQTVRQEPLSEQEVRFIQVKDSTYRATHSQVYLDSIDRVTNKITPLKILFTGYQHYKRSTERTWNFAPAIAVARPFFPGGLRVGYFTTYQRTFPNKKTLTVSLDGSYGFRNNNVLGDVRIYHKYNPFSQGFVNVNFGRAYDLIFFGDAFINLLRRSNFYEKNYAELEHGVELANGLLLRNSVEIAYRKSLDGLLFNTAVDSLYGSTGFFNQPVSFDPYMAFFASVTLEYTPFQKYLREPRQKIILGSKFPTAYVRWRKGIPGIFGSTINFDYVEVGIKQRMKLGLAGILQYNILSGGFPSQKNLQYVDYKFISRGNPNLFNNPLRSFQSMDSTFPIFNRFYEGHVLHQFNGAILNKIPLIKKLNLLEVAGGGFLLSPERDLRYVEAFFGIEKIIRIWSEQFKVGYYVAFSAANKYNTPFQFKIGIDQYNKRKNSWN